MHNLNKKYIFAFLILLVMVIAIPVGVYLAQKSQIFKSKASANPVLDAFELKDANGNVLTCDGSTNPPSCTTSTKNITVKVKNQDALITK